MAGVTNSTLSWNATSRQLTLTLGSTTASLNTSTGSSTATYTPDAAIQSSYGTVSVERHSTSEEIPVEMLRSGNRELVDIAAVVVDGHLLLPAPSEPGA
jgi:hypothetical protein